MAEYVTPVLWAAQFTGAASAAGVAAVAAKLTQTTGNTWTVDSLTAGVLVLRETSASGALAALWPVQAGQVVIVDPRIGILDRLAPADFAARYRRLPDVLADIETAMLADPTFLASLAASLAAVAVTPTPKAVKASPRKARQRPADS